MTHSCLIQSCESEAQFVCLCLSCESYLCEFHLRIHLSLRYRSHSFYLIPCEPCEWTKTEILEFLSKEKLKTEKLKDITNTYFIKNVCNPHNRIEEILESDLEQIKSLIAKVSQVSEQNPNSLNLQSDKSKVMILEDSEPYNSVQLFYKLSQLRFKTNWMLNKDKNDEEIEQEFRRTCSFYQNYEFDPLLSQALQEYINAYKKISSLYLLDELNKGSNLFIYDTDNEIEEKKALDPPGQLQNSVIITPLPNCELFYYGSINNSAIPFIIDKNYQFRQLPCAFNYKYTSAIYFNRSVYCFGGMDMGFSSDTACRFDIDQNRWVQLAQLPILDWNMSSVIFNSNILVSGNNNCLFYYLVEIDSFSEIPFDDSFGKRKLLINSKENVYVIELNTHWLIFESEAEDIYAWKQIGKSIISPHSGQVHRSYNKGGIYISLIDTTNFRQYFKFDFARKTLIEISCYHEHVAVRKLEGKIEAINCYGQFLKLNPDDVANFINKRYSLYYLGNCFEKIERSAINADPKETNYYIEKGCYLLDLDRNIEALECYNRVIELSPQHGFAYFWKGHSLRDMGRNLEAVECYNQAIKLNPNDLNYYIAKGLALHDIKMYYEAIECYNESLKTWNSNDNLNYHKGEALYALGKTAEALECFNEAINFKSFESQYFIAKAKALCDLNRKSEAIECYNQAINFKPNNFIYYYYRANVFNDIGQEEKSLQDFNRAYYLMSTHSTCVNHSKHSEDNYNFIDETVFEYIIGLMKMICKLEAGAVIFKEEIKKIKDANNIEIIKEIKEKENLIKEAHSKILKKAVGCLDCGKSVSIEVIQQVEKEAAEYQKVTINMCSHLWSLQSTQK